MSTDLKKQLPPPDWQNITFMKLYNTLNGNNCLKLKSGLELVGHFSENKLNGPGEITYPDGTNLKGEFLENNLHGKGEKSFPDGSVMKGDFENNL